jgi:hypothetical protein
VKGENIITRQTWVASWEGVRGLCTGRIEQRGDAVFGVRQLSGLAVFHLAMLGAGFAVPNFGWGFPVV